MPTLYYPLKRDFCLRSCIFSIKKPPANQAKKKVGICLSRVLVINCQFIQVHKSLPFFSKYLTKLTFTTNLASATSVTTLQSPFFSNHHFGTADIQVWFLIIDILSISKIVCLAVPLAIFKKEWKHVPFWLPC